MSSNFFKTLGPGILFASAAIGVSHLVQSTRAGAQFGFGLLAAVILANIIKYPFFEYGTRYTAATGESLLSGYEKLGKWALYVYLGITLVSMFAVSAAVTFVCAGLLSNLTGLSLSITAITGLLLFGVLVLLLIGKFSALDGVLKSISVLLVVSTIAVFIMTLLNGRVIDPSTVNHPDYWSAASISFTVALIGWMPTGVDMSVWSSLWTLARAEQTGYQPTVQEAVFEFRIGYLVSAFLAVCFLTLGAYILYGSPDGFSNSAVVFADQLVSLYTFTIGSQFKWIIAISTFSVMLSTTITVFDGYTRTLKELYRLLVKKDLSSFQESLVLIGLTAGCFFIISFWVKSLTSIVDFATTLSFILAPLIAYINLKTVQLKGVRKEHRINKYWVWFSWFGIALFVCFSLGVIFRMISF